MTELIIYLVWFVFGLLSGIGIANIWRSEHVVDGIFHVNLNDPEKDVFTLEMITPFDEVPSKKELYLKVNNVSK